MSRPFRRKEGDWFALPLAAGGYAIGVVARAPQRGDTLLGYFFGPIHNEVPTSDDVSDLTPDDAVMICRFLDEPLVSGRWPRIKSSENWERTAWPMPEFHIPHSQMVVGQSLAVTYSEDNPDRFLSQRPIPPEEESLYPPDEGVFPAGHLEHLVGESLGAPRQNDETELMRTLQEEGVRHFIRIPRDKVDEARCKLLKLGFDEVDVSDDENGAVYVAVFQRGHIGVLRRNVDAMEAKLADLAHSVGGEYDGPEWALPPP